MKRFLLIWASALLVLGCQKEVYHDITVSVNPAEGGSVSPSSGPVLDGTSVSFKATPKGDYVFTGWSGSLSGTENPKTVTVSQDMNVTANFTLRIYPLTITIEGDGTVAEKVISTKSEYQSGTVVELTAKPSDHWLFDHWEGDITGATNPAQITVSTAKNAKAVFVEKTYPLTVEIIGNGTIQEEVIATKSDYQEGTTVKLTAVPDEFWKFDHWEGDLEGNENPAQITVSSAKNVKAVFVEKTYPLTVEIIGNGTIQEEVIATKSDYQEGTTVKLTAVPDEFWKFDHWEGDLEGNENPAQITVSTAKNVKAVFVEKNYPLTIEIIGKGTVKEEVIATKSSYQEGTTVKLTAVPDEFWKFDHWEDGLEGTECIQEITVTGELTVRVVFTEDDPGIVYTETEYISAYEINKRMGMGWNVACQLDAYREDGRYCMVDEEAWGNKKLTQVLFDKAALAGFKSVRIPTTWLGTFGPAPDYKIDEERLNRVAEVVDYALNAGMYVIINMHHDDAGPHQEGQHPYPDDFWINPTKAATDIEYNSKVNEQLKAMWTQIARKFRDKGDHLIFESFNEPGSGYFWSWPTEAEKDLHQKEYDCLSEWNQTFVDAVRATGGNNASRWLVVVGGGAKERNLDRLKMPHDYVSNNRLMLAVHFYEPEQYVFGECEEWGHTAKEFNVETIRFDESFIESEFKRYKNQYLDKNIPLCVDEIGCFNRDTERGKAFQMYYLEYLVRAASLNGFATFIWDDGGRKDTFRGEYIFWHDTGEFFGYSEEIVNTIRNATYSTDPDYTLKSIYDRAPFYDPSDNDPINILDVNFKQYLISNFDQNGDGEISQKEAWRIVSIDVCTDNIKSLQGIEYFQNLQELRCAGTYDWIGVETGPGLLKSLDVSKNTKLRLLQCNNNDILSLDLSQNHELENLCIRSNGMTSLDLSHNPKLMWYDATFNEIKAIDLSENKEIRHFYHCMNKLTKISGLSLLKKLEILSLNDNCLTSLDVTHNTALKELEFCNNGIESIDLSYNQDLKVLNCCGNPSLSTVYIHAGQQFDRLEKDDFTNIVYDSGVDIPDATFRKYMVDHFDSDGNHSLSMDEMASVKEISVCTDNIKSLKGIEHCVNLEHLICKGSYDEEYANDSYYGVLEDIDVSNNTKLKYLDCSYNRIKILNVSGNTDLIKLYCQNNLIDKLNVSQNKLLETLVCRNCKLTALNVQNNYRLCEIDCQGSNRFSEVDISNCPDITLLNANGVGLNSVNISNNRKLSWLGCADGTFTSLDLSNNPELFCLYMNGSKKITTVDLTKNPDVKEIIARDCDNLQTIILNKGCSLTNLEIDDHTQIVYE